MIRARRSQTDPDEGVQCAAADMVVLLPRLFGGQSHGHLTTMLLYSSRLQPEHAEELTSRC